MYMHTCNRLTHDTAKEPDASCHREPCQQETGFPFGNDYLCSVYVLLPYPIFKKELYKFMT